MPKYKSNFIDEIINICQEDAPNNCCDACVSSVDECRDNLENACREYENRNGK